MKLEKIKYEIILKIGCYPFLHFRLFDKVKISSECHSCEGKNLSIATGYIPMSSRIKSENDIVGQPDSPEYYRVDSSKYYTLCFKEHCIKPQIVENRDGEPSSFS
ncbi:MAG: hypothetical protein P9L92_18135 [Candidatus Electryonea clarkiae]|nr:hypothetical protein [Candidatus Electryonea clarkiae]MDP8288182.1 hypothetical protein [Candidatus Electryonea clarkiae]